MLTYTLETVRQNVRVVSQRNIRTYNKETCVQREDKRITPRSNEERDPTHIKQRNKHNTQQDTQTQDTIIIMIIAILIMIITTITTTTTPTAKTTATPAQTCTQTLRLS